MTNQTAVERIIDTIMRGIETETFKVGDPLPPQREMSKLFGVSVVVIREAIKVLEGRGILMGKKGSGVYVLTRNPAGPPRDSTGPTNAYTLAEINQFARAIWLEATQDVVYKASDADIIEIMKRNKEMLDSYKSLQSQHQRLIYESSFGMSICKLSGNQLFYEFMSQLLRATIDIDLIIISEADYPEILTIDKKILEAMLSRDVVRVMNWSSERNRMIDKLISPHVHLFEKQYDFTFRLSPVPQKDDGE